MKPTDALSSLEATLVQVRSMLRNAKDSDQVTITFCVTVTPSSEGNVQIACGTGGHGKNIAFAISRIVKEATQHVPRARQKKFRDLIHKMEHIEENSKSYLPPEDLVRCPDTKLH